MSQEMDQGVDAPPDAPPAPDQPVGPTTIDTTRRMTIRRVIFDITGGREAKKGQVDAIESLLYDHKDTILVAATGYGKSMILYAFAALSRKITIIVVPLTKLGKRISVMISKTRSPTRSRCGLMPRRLFRFVCLLAPDTLCLFDDVWVP